MKLYKTFRFRLHPNKEQRCALLRMAGARRFVWNWALAQCQAHYLQTKKGLPYAELSRRLTALKRLPETSWLRESDAQALQQALIDLQRAYTNFFARRSRFPRFKSRKRNQPRFRIPQHVKLDKGAIYIPKVGYARIHQSQQVEGEAKSATFKQDAARHWDVALVTEFEMPDTSLPPARVAAIVGVDLGLKAFAVLSDGSQEPIPQLFRKAEQKLRRAQRVFSRRTKQSTRRLRARSRVARIHQHIANQRKDFLHKVTTRLVKQYEGICIEDLNVYGLAKTKLAKSILDASFGEFRRQLEYKTVWNRRHLVVIDRFFPSSKTCHQCGLVNDHLTLADRAWKCECGAHLDRDGNAAINIRTKGLNQIPLVAGHAKRLNARGPDVRLSQEEAVGVEAGTNHKGCQKSV